MAHVLSCQVSRHTGVMPARKVSACEAVLVQAFAARWSEEGGEADGPTATIARAQATSAFVLPSSSGRTAGIEPRSVVSVALRRVGDGGATLLPGASVAVLRALRRSVLQHEPSRLQGDETVEADHAFDRPVAVGLHLEVGVEAELIV